MDRQPSSCGFLADMRSPDAYQRRIRDVNRILLQLIPCLAVFLAGTTHAQSQAPVDIQLKEFGTGNTWRAGDTIGIRVELTSNQPGEQQYWVEWNLPTADGDTAQYGRRIALSPGQPRDLWLYGPLRPWFTGDTGMEIGVRTWEDADPGARIANLRFLPRSVGPAQLTSTTSLLGVLGTRQVGLEQYSAASGALNERPVSANEATTVVSIPSIDQFPDRWEGWRPLATATASW